MLAGRERSFRPAVLVCGDVAAVVAAVLVTGAPLWALALVPATLAALSARGQYRPHGALDTLRGVMTAVTVAAAVLLLAATTAGLEAGALPQAWMLAAGLLGAHRAATIFGRRGVAGTATVIVGSADSTSEIQRAIAARSDCGLRPIAVVDADLAAQRCLGDARDLVSLILETGGSEVVIAAGDASDRSIALVARACAEHGLGVMVRSGVGDAGGALAIEQIGPMALVRVGQVDAGHWLFALKHGFDRALAAVALLSIAPLFLVLALAVRASSPGPALYRQRRVGRDGREFDMLKFRSMRPAAPGEDAFSRLLAGSAPGGVEGADRRTAVGRLLRRTSLDELPQLLNVLRGDMSLVGPRPERPDFVDRFSADIDRYADRHRLKSGMTGLAQVNGLRGKTSIRDRVAYDNHYVEHWSLWLDAKILLRTVRAVFADAE
jgi:exopolysaccharide biosynthesis polyprenyl glycosylphosphotransferase